MSKSTSRVVKLLVSACAVATSTLSLGAAAATAPASAQTTGPSCTFNGSSLPIVTDVEAGSQVKLSCTGLPPLQPYLLAEMSLVIGIDPATSGLLTGGITSLTGLESLLSSLGLLNTGALDFVASDLSGDLNVTYTVPSSQALDPNASCPPSTEEYNSGLIGCALAMINLSNFSPVAAGSGVLEYKGFNLLPPTPPNLNLSATKVAPGQTVNVSDTTGATTYWWLATLAQLGALLGGGAGSNAVSVKIGKGDVVNNVALTPASYVSGPLDTPGTFTPPSISGSFTVPLSEKKGRKKVTVTESATVEGLTLQLSSSATIKVS